MVGMGILRTLALAWAILVWICLSHVAAFAQEAPRVEPRAAPLTVEIGIRIDQVTFVDQKSENFGAVAELHMRWRDAFFAFDPDAEGRDHLLLGVNDFMDLADENGRTVPRFIFRNLQGPRWWQEELVTIFPDGEIKYFERVTMTLQAPYMEFRSYPFDTQTFTLEVISVNPSDTVVFVPMAEISGLGKTLGEEAWRLFDAKLVSGSRIGPSGLESDLVYLEFQGERHVQYFLLRIFVPALIIIAVSWVTFFLNDYSKRIDIAGANLLVFVAFNFAISDALPQLGYITFLDFLLQSVFAVNGGIVVLNVLLRRLVMNDRSDLAHKIDTYAVKWVLPIVYGAVLVVGVSNFLGD